MTKLIRALSLGAALLVALAVPAAALDETVAVTSVSIDRVAYLSSSAASIRVTGTIACEAAGPAGHTSTRATQGRTIGHDNLDLLDFGCAASPRPFTVIAESFDCDEFSGSGCFKRGNALVEIRGEGNQLLASRRVSVRPAAGAEVLKQRGKSTSR